MRSAMFTGQKNNHSPKRPPAPCLNSENSRQCGKTGGISDPRLAVSAEGRIHQESTVVMQVEDLRDRAFAAPRLLLVAVQQLIVVLEQALQAKSSGYFLGRVLGRTRAELFVHLGVEAVHEKVGPELVKILHVAGSLSGLDGMTSLKCLLAQIHVALPVPLATKVSRLLAFRPDDVLGHTGR